MLARMREALKPQGRVALLEYRVEDGTGDHILADHRMSVRQVMSEWIPAGFELTELLEFLPAQHLFVFTKSPATDAPSVIRHRDLLDAISEGLVEVEARETVPARSAFRSGAAAPSPWS